MEIQDLIQQLYKNRKITTDKEFRLFQGAIEKLANHKLTIDLIPQLLKVFDDTCEHYEVMYGLVHLIEDFEYDYIQPLVTHTSSLYLHAKRWLETFYIRILNDEESTLRLRNILLESPELINDSLMKILNSIIERIPERFEPKVKALLAKD